MPLRPLGLTAALLAPALLVGALLDGFSRNQGAPNDLSPYLYLLFAVGWFCSMVGLRSLRATGQRRFGRVVATLPLVTLPLAMLQSVFDLAGLGRSSPLYLVSDLAWPLSMLLTLIVGVTVLVAGTLKGWGRFVPLFCGLGLPVALLLGALFGESALFWSFPLHTALGWALLGYVVYRAVPRGLGEAALAHGSARERTV